MDRSECASRRLVIPRTNVDPKVAYVQRRVASGDLVSRITFGIFRSSIVLGSIQAIRNCFMVSTYHVASCFYLYATHVINFTISLIFLHNYNIEKLREPGDEASSCNSCNYCKACKIYELNELSQNMKSCTCTCTCM